MDFLVNDLSIASQFHDIPSFHEAVERVMEIRNLIRQHGFELYCHRNIAHAQVTPSAVMQQAIQGFERSKQRAWMQWLTLQGPYWEDARMHGANDWLDVNGTIVTDSAIGEAAVCCCRGLLRETVSLEPSAWLFTPVKVRWVHEDESEEFVTFSNHWAIHSIAASIQAKPKPIESWVNLDMQVKNSCRNIIFSESAFEPLEGHPFVPAAAKQIRLLLQTLDRFKGCFDVDGKRTAEGHRLFREHFSGANAWFSDSSDTEKNDFRNDLTFPHPKDPSQSLFCSWHGKVRTQFLRIHFSWPVTVRNALYVVYVGPKITKQ